MVDMFSQNYSKIETIEFKDVISEVADCQVYADLFEIGEVSALNKSFGVSHFEFDLDINVLSRIYKAPKLFSTEELTKILSEFVPSVLEIKGIGFWCYFSFINLNFRTKSASRKQTTSQF